MTRVTSVYLLSALVAVTFVTVSCEKPGKEGSGAEPGVPKVSTPPAPTPVPAKTEPDLRGFAFPIAGGCLPKSERLIPGAPRPYRKGVHEGIDFYDSDNCTPIKRGTEVLAAKAGRVVRADLSYVDLTTATVAIYLKDPTAAASVDQFRGRQVWIDHGAGVVTRYCHLSGIAPGVTTDMAVTAGQLIAFVGESGTPSSLQKPGSQYHLHFEVRMGDTYLGHGLPAKAVRPLYEELFGVAGK
jgi:murein DD-endopeptidase MepM/ murein hydrolase activator NlpD